MAGVRVWVRGSGTTLAEEPRDAFDLVEVLEQECTVTSVLIVCQKERISQKTGTQELLQLTYTVQYLSASDRAVPSPSHGTG